MFTYLRARFHPLWRLRRSRVFRQVQELVDFPVRKRGGSGLHYYAYWLRDASHFLPHEKGLEVHTRDVVTHISEALQPTLFLDVGANLGTYTLKILGRFRHCQALIFEPDKANARLLEKTLRKNGFARAELIRCAVSSCCGEARFLVDKASGATGSLDANPSDPWSLQHAYGLDNYVLVPTVCLDAYWDKLKPHSAILIKIDVEGSEHRVLEGAARVLAELRPIVVLECFEEVKLRAFFTHGYAVYDLQEDGNRLALPSERADLISVAEGKLNLHRLSPSL